MTSNEPIVNQNSNDWQGTDEEARAIIERADKIAATAYATWQAALASPGNLDKFRGPFPVGSWVCEATSMIRNEPAVWRVGRVVVVEPDPLMKGEYEYQIETIHGQWINWRNCKMIPVFDTFQPTLESEAANG